MRKFLMALMSALLLLSVAAAGVSAAGGEESALELLAGQGKTLAAGAIAYSAADSSATITDRTDGSWDFEGLKLSGKVMASDGTVKELSELTLSYSARFSALDPGENPQGYYGVGLNLSSAGTDMQRVRLWQDGGVYVQATEKTVFTESGNLDSAGEYYRYSADGSWLLEVRIAGNELSYYLDGHYLGASTAKEAVASVGLYTCNVKASITEISLKVLGAEGWYEPAALPDFEGHTNYMAALADGSYADAGFGGDPVQVSGGTLTGSAGKNGLYPLPSEISGREILTLVKDGAQTQIQATDAEILSVVDMYPDEGATHTLNFSPRNNTETGALAYIAVGINKEGSAHGYNVFLEQRSAYGDFTRSNLISDVRTLLGADYDLSRTDGSQRVRLYVLTKGAAMSVWMSYTGNSGETWSSPALIYDAIPVVVTTPQFAPMFLNSGSGVYTNFAQYCLDEDSDVPPPAKEVPSLEGLKNFVTGGDGVYPEAGGFGGGSASMENGILSGSGGANAKYAIPTYFSDKDTVGVIRNNAYVNLQVQDLTFLTAVDMWADEGSTHTLTFSPRGNTATGANVLIRVGINKQGSAHGFNVFLEQRADGGEFVRSNMISDVRTLMGGGYDMSKTDGSQRVRLYIQTKGTNLTLWMAYSSDGGAVWSQPVLIYENVEIVATTLQCSPFFLDGGSGVFTNFALYNLENIEPAQPIELPVEEYPKDDLPVPPANTEQIMPELPERGGSGCAGTAGLCATALMLAAAALIKRFR